MELQTRLKKFEKAWPFLEPALVRFDHYQTKQDVWEMLESGAAQLWSTDRAAVVTQIEDKNGTKCLFGWLAGGNRSEINALRTKIEVFAKGQGCTKSRSIMRPGFLKKRLHTGDKLVGLIMERDL